MAEGIVARRSERLAKVFVEVADTLVAEFDVIELLQMLADRAAGMVDAADPRSVVGPPLDRPVFREGVAARPGEDMACGTEGQC